MRLSIHTSALALTTAAVIATGCGGSSGGHPKTTSARSAAASTGAMSTSQYLDAIARIEKPLQDANSAYFHTKQGATGEQFARLRVVRAAYLEAAGKFAALRAPAAAVAKSAKLVALYRTTARKLAGALKARNASRAYAIAINGSETAGPLYTDLFTIPG